MKNNTKKTNKQTVNTLVNTLSNEQIANSLDFHRWVINKEICPILTSLFTYWKTLEEREIEITQKPGLDLVDWLEEEEKEVEEARDAQSQFHELLDYTYLALCCRTEAQFLSCCKSIAHLTYISTRFRAWSYQPFRKSYELKVDSELLCEWMSSQQKRSRSIHFESVFMCANVLYCLANDLENNESFFEWNRIGEPHWDFFADEDGEIRYRG